MPAELRLPKSLRSARWKVKIQEKESREPPHVSILRGTDKGRINLRTAEFMDQRPAPALVPDDLLAIIEQNWPWLCQQWDLKYPDNPVAMAEDADHGGEDDPPDAE